MGRTWCSWPGLLGFAGALTLAGPRSGRAAMALWLPRLLAQAWAPWIVVLGAVCGLRATARGRRSGLLAMAGACAAASYCVVAGGGSWAGRPRLTGSSRRGATRRTVAVGVGPGGAQLLADLWEPAVDGPRSGLGVVYLHGGLWQALDKGFWISALMRAMTGRGHVVLDLAYPLAPAASLEDMDRAVQAAAAWLRAPGEIREPRPGRIALVGHAGGGHLALVRAFQDPASVCGVVAVSAVTDPVAFWTEYGRVNRRQPGPGEPAPHALRPRLRDATALDRLITRLRLFPAYRYGNLPGGATLVHDLFGGTPVDGPDRYAAWSPVALAGPASPPVLQVTGAHDAVVPPSHGRRLHEALAAAGAATTLVEIRYAVHGFDQYPGVSRALAPAARRATFAILDFLDGLR